MLFFVPFNYGIVYLGGVELRSFNIKDYLVGGREQARNMGSWVSKNAAAE